MPTIRGRIAAAVSGFRSGKQVEKYNRASIRQSDRANQGRREPLTYLELLGRFQGYVYTCITIRAQAVASTPLRVYDVSGGSQEWSGNRLAPKDRAKLQKRAGFVATKIVEESSRDDMVEITDPHHPLKKLLDQVNCNDNGYDMLEDISMSLDYAGNAYQVPVMGPNNWPVELYNLQPQWVQVRPCEDDTALIGSYVYGRERGIEEVYAPEGVIHYKTRNPHSPFYGFPPLAACVTEADVSTGFAEFVLASLRNGLAPSVAVSASKGLTPEQVEQITDQFEGKYGSQIHAGKMMVFEGPIDGVHTMDGTSNREASFLASDKHYRERIANVFRVPVGLMTMEDASRAASAEAINQMQRLAVSPSVRKVEDVINAKLVPMFDTGQRLFVAFDDPVDENDKPEVAVSLYQSGLITMNEARLSSGFDEVDGGDDFRAEPAPASPFGGLFGGGGGLSMSPPPAMAEPDPLQLVEARSLPKREPVVILQSDMMASDDWGDCCTKAPSGHTITQKDDRAGPGVVATERDLERALRSFFGDLSGTVLDSVREGQGLSMRLSSDSTINEALADAISDPLMRRFLIEYNRTVGNLDDPDLGEIDMTNDRAVAYLRENPPKLANQILQTLDQRIGDALADGIEQGEDLGGLRGRVESIIGDPKAAERIARTESAHAFMEAREGAWMDSNVVMGKEWLLSSDPCPICEGIVATRRTVPKGEAFYSMGDTIPTTDGKSFSVNWRDIKGPPAHPNCRCSMGAVFVEVES